ncbi:MAG: squalene/phytoene synthase family protein [Candidatus Tumulicola sp.]
MRRDRAAAAPDLTLDAADAYCRFLTNRHYENFSVASRFVDGERRADLSRIYAFCRSTDDLGDESPNGSAEPRLTLWRDEVEAMFAGIPPVHPVLQALARTIERRRIPAAPFLNLIEANLMDQHVKTYAGWEELERYCTLSAAPVGRMVLRVFEVTDAACERLSDDVCIGLQLANHAQDVSRDAVLGRTYLLQSDLARGGVEAGVRGLVERARVLLQSGRVLERRIEATALRMQLALYRMGGEAICDAIERIGYRTDRKRPSVTAAVKVSLVARALGAALRRTHDGAASVSITPHTTK